MKTAVLLIALLSCFSLAQDPIDGERISPPAKGITPPTKEWSAKIEALAPTKATAKPKAERRVLVFHLYTGFNHQVIPHANEVFRVLSAKTGAFEVDFSTDIEVFAPKSLARYDAVVLNNCCSNNPERNLFLDVLAGNIAKPHAELGKPYAELSDEDRQKKAAALEKSLLEYVAGGGGMVCVHGAMVLLNNSPEFSTLIGGSFDYHPPSQELTLRLTEPDHPLLKAFAGKTFTHTDEPYLFKGAYAKKSFRPLLEMRVSELQGVRGKVDEVQYVSWIKRHGKGRVFYVSPSHYPETYKSAAMLRFYLDGLQYALGDFECEDTPPK